MVADRLRVDSLGQLRAALEGGWQVEPPIYTFTDRLRQRVVYQFILWRDSQAGVATIYDDPQVQQFIATHAYPLKPLL